LKNPPYRTTFDDLSKYYGGSANAAFKHGNYAYTAHISDNDPLLKAVSLVMLGNPQKGVELISQLPQNTESLLYRSIGNWFLNNLSEAYTDLELLDVSQLSGAEQQCIDLIKGKTINVLMVNREFDAKKFVKNSQFNILTIGYSSLDDIALTFDDDMSSVTSKLQEHSFVPDVIIAYRPEYQLIPIMIECFSCPKIAFVSDYDLHVYQKYSDFMRFDAFVVYSGVDHYELARLTEKPVFTHILSHSIDMKTNILKVKPRDRQYDLHVTGSSFRRFFADKSIFLYQLTQLDKKLAIRVDDGFISPARYAKTLDNTRIVPTYVRYYGCFPTRGVEALVHGAEVLYQDGGVLESFLTPCSDGIYAYPEQTDTATLQKIVYQILDGSSARKTSTDSNYNVFDASSSVPVFLKFCAIISKHLPYISTGSPQNSFRKDICVVGIDDLHGGIAKGLSGEEHCRNFERMIHYNLSLPNTPQSLNSSAILYTYWLMHIDRGLTWYQIGSKERLLNGAVKIWEHACKLFKTNLVIKFNLARFYFHFGKVNESKPLFVNLVENYTGLLLDPVNDDIMSALFFFEDYFPYREYIDTIIGSKIDENTTETLKNIIISASAFYIALIHEGDNDVASAIKYAKLASQIYPDNHIAAKCLSTLQIKSLPESPSKQLRDEIISNFEKSVLAYPLNLHLCFPEYIDLLIKSGDNEVAKSALESWFLFFSRVRKSGELLPIDTIFVTKLLKHTDLMSDDAKQVFSSVARFLCSGDLLNNEDEFTEEVILALTKQVEVMEKYVKGISCGKITIRRKETYRIIARRLLYSKRHLLSLRFYLLYFIRVLFYSKTYSVVDKITESLECIADILMLYPRLFLVARLTRQRLLRILRVDNG
jgi:tetratricopeptide (TPR) repeat protein